MSLESIRMEHVRGALLGLLLDGTWLNDSMLHQAVNAIKNVDASRDQVRAAIRWLAEQTLVEMREADAESDMPGTLRARISQRGRDFEAGRIFVEGVHRPSRI